ncbi:MAG TPA: O-antigen ligase family protein, partial [Flavobacteriales bacterium]|nr:O-antigen ligase family protein [Flavobacteriales bacterium]
MAGGYVVMVIWPDVAISHGGRLRGVFGNPNGLGIFCILVYTLFFIVNQRFPDLFERKEKLFFVLFMLYVTISTGSRTALMAIMLFHMFHYLFKRSVFLGFFIFILVLMSVEFFILYFPKIIIALDLQKSFRLETLQEGSGRTIAWNFAWQNIQQSLLVGKGLAYDEYLMRTNFDFLSKEGHQGGVHNTYLIMWLNTGLIGLIFFLRGFFLLFYRASKHSSYAYPVMIAIMLSINFEPWLAASLNPYTILFLIIITVLSLDDWLVEKQKVTEIEDELSNEGITT